MSKKRYRPEETNAKIREDDALMEKEIQSQVVKRQT